MRTQEPDFGGFQDDEDAVDPSDVDASLTVDDSADAAASSASPPHRSPAGSWVLPVLAAEGVSWESSEVTLLERALAGTDERYRVNILRALINCGYRPTDELFLQVALFGKMAEVAWEVPEQLAGAKIEFEALVDKSATSVAQNREAFEGFTLSVQRVMESVNERMREQAGNLATDHISAAIAAKDAELRIMISNTIGDTTRIALGKAFADNSSLIEAMRTATSPDSVAAALALPPAGNAKAVGIPIPFHIVSKGGIAVNGKSLLPICMSGAIALFVGIEIGHHFPPPQPPDIVEKYGRSVIASRPAMPPNVRVWLDEHVHSAR